MSLIKKQAAVIINGKEYAVDKDVALYIDQLWQVHQSVCTRLQPTAHAALNNAPPYKPEIIIEGSALYTRKRKPLIKRK